MFVKDIGDKYLEGSMYVNFGNVFYSLGDFEKLINYYNLYFRIVKEVGNKIGEVKLYYMLGENFEL